MNMIKYALQRKLYNSKSTQLKSNRVLVFRERGNQSTPRKSSRVENQQTQHTYDTESGNQTQDTLVEGERSHHCANPAPLKQCITPTKPLSIFY